jgi:hypothetical protein
MEMCRCLNSLYCIFMIYKWVAMIKIGTLSVVIIIWVFYQIDEYDEIYTCWYCYCSCGFWVKMGLYDYYEFWWINLVWLVLDYCICSNMFVNVQIS